MEGFSNMENSTAKQNNPWSPRKKLAAGFLIAGILSGIGYGINRFYSRDNTIQLAQDRPKQNEEKIKQVILEEERVKEAKVVADIMAGSFGLRTNMMKRGDSLCTEEELKKIVQDYNVLNESASKTNDKDDDISVLYTRDYITKRLSNDLGRSDISENLKLRYKEAIRSVNPNNINDDNKLQAEDEKRSLEVIIACQDLQIEAIATKNKSVYDLHYTKDEADKLVGKFKSIVDDAIKTKSKDDDLRAKITGDSMNRLFESYGVVGAEDKDHSAIVKSEISRLGETPKIDLSKISREEIQKGQENIAQTNKILNYVNKLDITKKDAEEELRRYRDNLMKLLISATKTSLSEDDEAVNNALYKTAKIMQEIKGHPKEKLPYGNLEEMIFAKKITHEEFKQMTQGPQDPFYDLHKIYGGDMQKLSTDMHDPTIKWYMGQLENPDVDNWTAWTRFDASHNAVGKKLELLYMAGEILSSKHDKR